jgi:hypothetical protein
VFGPSRSRDRPQAHGHSHRGGSRHGMNCPPQPCCRLPSLANQCDSAYITATIRIG